MAPGDDGVNSDGAAVDSNVGAAELGTEVGSDEGRDWLGPEPESPPQATASIPRVPAIKTISDLQENLTDTVITPPLIAN